MAQEIIRISTINTSVVNVATTEVIKIEGVGLQGSPGVPGDPGGVTSVNGDVGVVVLDTDDISDSGQTNKYATAAQLTVIDNQSGTNTGDQDISGIATNASDIVDINTAQGVQDTAIATINSTAIFMHPDSPHVRKLDWLGNQFQYDLILLNGGTYTTDTNYDVNDSLDSKFFFKTKNKSPITPALTGISPDSRSIGSNEVTILADGTPSYSYADDSIEHLVRFENFDPLDVTSINFQADGVVGDLNVSNFVNIATVRANNNLDMTSITGFDNLVNLGSSGIEMNSIGVSTLDFPNAPNCGLVRIANCPNLTAVNDLDQLTSSTILEIYNGDIQGDLDTPVSAVMTSMRFDRNSSMTSIGTLIGCIVLINIQLYDCALDQTTVDMVLVDSYANALSGTLTNGSINLSGGTNAIPSNTTPVNDAISGLLGLGYTLTLNS